MNGISRLLSAPALATSVVLYITALVIYRLVFHPLAKFPGPKLAAVTRLYEAYYDIVQGGRYTWRIEELHKEYGPIIRISPYEIHINDPSFHAELYKQGAHWNKYSWTYDAFGVPSASVGTTDHALHRRRRTPLNPYFSKPAVLKRHDIVTSRVAKLRDRMSDLARSSSPFNLGAALSAMTTDISTEYTLGESYNNLDHPDFNEPMMHILQGSGAIWRFAKHIRIVGPIMRAIPLSVLEKIGDSSVVEFVAYLKRTLAKVKQLMADFAAEERHDEDPSNLVDVILGAPGLPSSEKALLRIYDEISTVTGAGLETVASTLRLLVFYLYSNEQMLAQLRAELRLRMEDLPAGQSVLSLSQLEQLPYLTGVVMEGLRLSPGVVSRMARIAPDEDLIYAKEWVIPAGTPVGMTTFLMHLDEEIYKDARRFDPSRWADLDQRRGEAAKTFAPFSKGTRNCLGMHLAWAELYFSVAMLVLNFDLDLLNTSHEDVDVYTDQFIAGVQSQKGLRAIPSLI